MTIFIIFFSMMRQRGQRLNKVQREKERARSFLLYINFLKNICITVPSKMHFPRLYLLQIEISQTPIACYKNIYIFSFFSLLFGAIYIFTYIIFLNFPKGDTTMSTQQGKPKKWLGLFAFAYLNFPGNCTGNCNGSGCLC